MNRPFIRVIVGLAILGSFFLTPAVEEAAAQRKYLSLGTGNPGGTFYFGRRFGRERQRGIYVGLP